MTRKLIEKKLSKKEFLYLPNLNNHFTRMFLVKEEDTIMFFMHHGESGKFLFTDEKNLLDAFRKNLKRLPKSIEKVKVYFIHGEFENTYISIYKEKIVFSFVYEDEYFITKEFNINKETYFDISQHSAIMIGDLETYFHTMYIDEKNIPISYLKVFQEFKQIHFLKHIKKQEL